MIFQNGRVFSEGHFQNVDVRVVGERIAEIGENLERQEGEEAVCIRDCMLLPGFFDVHTHGRDGADFSDAPAKELVRIRNSYAACGVTSLLATTMTMEEEYSKNMMKRIREAIEADER